MKSSIDIKEWTTGVRGKLVLGLVVALMLTVFVVYKRDKARPVKPAVEPVNMEIQMIESEISIIQNMRPLASLSAYWREASFAAPIFGVQLVEMQQPMMNADGTMAAYQGPLKSWNAAVQGDFIAVLGFIREMQGRIPLFVYTIQKEGQRGAAAVSFVGTEG